MIYVGLVFEQCLDVSGVCYMNQMLCIRPYNYTVTKGKKCILKRIPCFSYLEFAWLWSLDKIIKWLILDSTNFIRRHVAMELILLINKIIRSLWCTIHCAVEPPISWLVTGPSFYWNGSFSEARNPNRTVQVLHCVWVVYWTEARTRAQCTHAIEIRSHD